MAKKKLTEAGRAQLVNKCESIIGQLMHLGHMLQKKGVTIGSSQGSTIDAQRKVAYIRDRVQEYKD